MRPYIPWGILRAASCSAPIRRSALVRIALHRPVGRSGFDLFAATCYFLIGGDAASAGAERLSEGMPRMSKWADLRLGVGPNAC